MRRTLSSFSLLVLGSALAAQAPVGETPFTPNAGEAPRSASASPLVNPFIVPAAQRSAFGNSNNNIPFSWTPCCYQQVFAGSEMPANGYPVRGLGLRQDNQFQGFAGYVVEMEIKLGYSTFDHTTLNAVFASNFNSGTPVTVLPRVKVQLPNMPGVLPTNPDVLFIQIPFTTPFIWTPVAGRNLVIDVQNYGNSNNNSIFTYPLDADSATTTTRLYNTAGPGQSSGTLGTGYGMMMAFLDQIKTTASYIPFGKGCPGTGGRSGVVLPASLANAMGNSNNYYGIGKYDQRYQQVFLGSEIGRPRVFTSHWYRAPATTTGRAGGAQNLEIRLSSTTVSDTTMSATYASNVTGTETTVFNTVYNYPTLSGTNTDPQKWDVQIKYAVPFVWTGAGNLLIEIRNTSTADLSYFMDASSPVTTTRLYASPVTAASGTLGTGYGLAMFFDDGGNQGSAIPVLEAVGRPVLGQGFDVALKLAKGNTAAVLLLGASKTQWGAFTLPLNLAALGAPLCDLLVSFDLAVGIPVSAQGDGKVTFNIPNVPALDGLVWHNQYFVADAQANGFGFSFSNGGTATVGGQ